MVLLAGAPYYEPAKEREGEREEEDKLTTKDVSDLINDIDGITTAALSRQVEMLRDMLSTACTEAVLCAFELGYCR